MTLDTNKTTGDTIEAVEWNEAATAANKVTNQTLEVADISDFSTYINQPLLTTSDVTFGEVTLDSSQYDTATANPTHNEGLVFYDNTKKALSYYNDESDITVNLGQEVLIPIRNETGSTITNGTVLYPSGGTGGVILTDLADASLKDKSRLIAVATHDIENNSNGYVTRLGAVGGLNTSSYNEGDIVYLSADTPGEFTTTKPDDGGYVVVVGVIAKSDATSGILSVDVNIAQTTVEVTDTNGFPSDQRTATTLSFVDGTRTFSITPTGSMFHYYILGDKYEITGTDSVVITDVTGTHLIYYDGDTLTSIANPNAGEVDNLIRTKCTVAYVYWNSTDGAHYILGDERHGISMSPITHSYLHFTRGSQYVSGLALGDITLGTGSLNADAQFSTEAGMISDEDLPEMISAVASTTGLDIMYRSGATGEWKRTTNTGYSFLTGATPLAQYNEYTGATWQLTEATSGNYIVIHIFGTNDTSLKPIAIVGLNEYSTVANASSGANDEINQVIAMLPSEEFVPIASVIYETKTSFTNSVNTRIVANSEGNDYTDWRFQEITPGGGVSNHSSLSGLNNDDHIQYILADGTRSFTGQVTIDQDTDNIALFVDSAATSQRGAYIYRNVVSSADGLLTVFSDNASDTGNLCFFRNDGSGAVIKLQAGSGAGIDMTDSFIDNVETVKFNAEYDNGNSGAAKTINLTNGQKQKVTITATTTITLADLPIGNYQLKTLIDATGGYTITIAASSGSLIYPSSTVVTIDNTANAKNMIYIYSDGTDYWITGIESWGTA